MDSESRLPKDERDPDGSGCRPGERKDDKPGRPRVEEPGTSPAIEDPLPEDSRNESNAG